ncbi:hypothetical protein M9Y10_041810 [Tritrichomonas musculus]|uniref:Uncharacterized protein n=1 Tax=Tritrichomonas musculus TaxID=1915356 RepID=A0ABR2K612_9EUKA
MNSNSELPDPVQVDSRCRVIKVLQEHISNQTNENTDLNQLKAQLLITEQECQMKESQYKLRIDDLEYEVEQLRKENQKMKSTLIQNKALLLNQNNNDDSEMAKKYQKWKSKYHSLINNDPTFQNAAKIYQLESNLKSHKLESQKKVDEVTKLADENDKLKIKIMQLNEEIKKTKAALDNSTLKNTSLQNQINLLAAENRKLSDETKQKGTLLEFNRKVQARDQKTSKEKEQSVKNQLRRKVEENLNLQAEITRLKGIFDKEMKEKRIIVKKFNFLKQKQDDTAELLNQQVIRLKTENDSLIKELDEARESVASLDNEVTTLKSEQTVSEIKLKRADKLKEHNIKLSQAITEMQGTIDHLQSSISSIESDSTAKTEQLRALLIKHYAGVDPSMEWDDIVRYIDNIIEQLRQSNEENSQLAKKLKRAHKNNSFLKAQSENNEENILKKNDELQYQIEMLKQQIKKLESVKKSNSALFSRTIRKKIDSGFFTYYNSVNSILAKFYGTDYSPITFRSLILMSILATRFRHYKKSDPYDGSIILEFAKRSENPSKSPLSDLSDKVNELIEKAQKSNEMNSDLKNSNDDLQDKIQKCLAKCKELQTKINELTRINDDLQRNFNELKSDKTNAALAEYNDLESKFQQKTKEYNEIEKQLYEMKVEMKRLISTVDEHHRNDESLQETIEDLTIELEQLRQSNARLKQELDICQLSLKEKNREILALERKLLKQKAQVVVVKDQIPASFVPPPAPDDSGSSTKKNDFYMTDSLRNTLCQMQNRLMKTSEMI